MRRFIPLGIDCTLARYLRDRGLRERAYPFDWTVTYEGIYEAVSERFEKMFNLIPDREGFNFGKQVPINSYALGFFHDKKILSKAGEKYQKKYDRRIKRFYHALEGEEELVFIRKAHFARHHGDYKKIKNVDEMDDILKFRSFLLQNYKQLKFKIIYLHCCHLCDMKNHDSLDIDVINLKQTDNNRLVEIGYNSQRMNELVYEKLDLILNKENTNEDFA